MYWDYDGLWQKAKLYAHRAIEADRDGAMFPFWLVLCLEFLARATLSRVNPCLLADPMQGDNLLYACGFPSNTAPVSIKAKTVFLRCQRIVPSFTEEEFMFCMSLVTRRNEELHTSSPAFEDFPTRLWLAKFFRICGLLLDAQGRSLIDLFGDAQAKAAQRMVEAEQDQRKKEAFDLISAARRTFEAQSRDQLPNLREQVAKYFKAKQPLLSKLTQCPSCEEVSLMVGEQIDSSEPRLEDDEIVEEIFVLPTKLVCLFCGLSLEGHALLHGAELAGQFSVYRRHDPVEFHQIDPAEYFDPANYFEEEYGND